MSNVRFDDVSLAFGLKPLLDGVNFSVDAGERVCLVGRNGEGKSSLLKIVSGDVVPDSGFVRFQDGVTVGTLPQDIPDATDKTVFEVVAEGLDEVGGWIARYHELIQHADSGSSLVELERVQAKIEASDGWSLNNKVDHLIKRFNLDPDKKMNSLSGGWRRRVLLAKALVNDPDVLILDEPTNHLDIPAISWLEKQLIEFRGALLFVSHDRSFIKRLATRIVELDRGNLTSWPGNYERYLEGKGKLLEDEARQNALFDKKLSEEEVWIRQGIKARRTRNEGRVRNLEGLRKVRQERREKQGRAKISLDDASLSGKLVAEASNISFSYPGGETLIKNLSLAVMRGDRIGLIGENGTGKTTLLKLLLGSLEPTEGTVRTGTKLDIAYFDQLRSALDPEKTVIDSVSEGREFLSIGGKDRHIISYLNDFLFTAARSRSPVKALSGGETNRLLLAKLFSKPANILVMDEPTNDLDVDTLELLEELLTAFKGTLLITSHDRYFLDNVVTSTLVFEKEGKVQEYIGGYSDWVAYTGGFDELGKEKSSEKSNVVSEPSPAPKITQEKQKAETAKGKKLSYKHKLELEKLPAQIESLETLLEQLQEAVGSAEFYNQDHELVSEKLAELESIELQLNEAMDRWVELESMAG
ncbi:ATP-binding cassette domain-containing protein [Alkalimarinus alittae]|uniref:ATP-binding protein Uup n=1 Tax=Alkalimarinus alittae TaxID=2961619 RepID=A0ABY6N6I5_9ALTE|nr:ATP-binding cassette domain-containing protein [Alkalimarinus alittae]UZE97728.1 ATP-binding cassette domain-containing protein [Alkalimarinus alittae]